MPVVSFDAESTEWQLARLMEDDPEIQWWLRLRLFGQAFIQTTGQNYYPDFIAIDKDGAYWLIEGKSDKEAQNADVQAKAEAAVKLARAIRDDGDYGDWHYLFATETTIKDAQHMALGTDYSRQQVPNRLKQ